MTCEDCIHQYVCEKRTCAECVGIYCDECEIYCQYDGKPDIENCKDFINKADVVPVVRCKDCKNYNEVGCANGFGWCEQFNYGQTDEQFCSYGDRKE